LKWVNGGAVLGLCFLIYTTQKKIWLLDMDARHREQPDWTENKPRFRAEIVLEKSYVPAEECTY
jgi:hypothetical protein